jgi:hypothetical protein
VWDYFEVVKSESPYYFAFTFYPSRGTGARQLEITSTGRKKMPRSLLQPNEYLKMKLIWKTETLGTKRVPQKRDTHQKMVHEALSFDTSRVFNP